jgi:hypothetical protein
LLYESGAIILIAGACWIISRVKIDQEHWKFLVPYSKR